MFLLTLLLALVLQATNGCYEGVPNLSNYESYAGTHNSHAGHNLKDESCGTPPSTCPKTNYRSYDGSCNNLQNPGWGMAFSRYVRMVRPIYADKKSAIPLAKSGKPLPNARFVSNKMFPDKEVDDNDFTLINMQWAQLVSHDMSRLAEFTHPKTIKARCCTESGKPIEKSKAHSSCLPIIPPKTEPNFPETLQCINFARSQTDRDRKCKGQRSHVEQLSQVTGYLDLSLVYGNSEAEAKTLRSFKGGRLLTENRLGEDWLPDNKGPNTACDEIVNHTHYLTGDGRANQNPQLTILQVIFMREHNGVADILAKLNPHWDDERLFQEARRINIAMYQHITYDEFLGNLLGAEFPSEARKKFPKYDPKVNPSVANEHAGSAFRYFHSSIQGRLDLVTEDHSKIGQLRLSDWYCRPRVIESGYNFEFLARGLVTQPAHYTGLDFTKEQKHFLFRNGREFGLDLRSIDIQRNRDHGLGSYNDLRQFCGFKRATKWEDYLDFMVLWVVEDLRAIYTSHEDLDLTIGAQLEVHVDGTLAGPTLLCIMKNQFIRSRVGDRFFYDHEGMETSFSKAQLNEIRKVSVARLFCDNVPQMKKIQSRAFVRVNSTNVVVDCSKIPAVDLTQWREKKVTENELFEEPFEVETEIEFDVENSVDYQMINTLYETYREDSV